MNFRRLKHIHHLLRTLVPGSNTLSSNLFPVSDRNWIKYCLSKSAIKLITLVIS